MMKAKNVLVSWDFVHLFCCLTVLYQLKIETLSQICRLFVQATSILKTCIGHLQSGTFQAMYVLIIHEIFLSLFNERTYTLLLCFVFLHKEVK